MQLVSGDIWSMAMWIVEMKQARNIHDEYVQSEL